MANIILWIIIAIIITALGAWIIAPDDGFFLDSYLDPGNAWALLILPLLIGSLVAHRVSLGEVGRSILLWGGLFAVLIIGYTFKDDASSIFGRVMASVSPGTVVEREDGSVLIARGEDGHFHIDGHADGRAVRFLLDTGATSTVLTYETAQEIGLDPDQLSFVHPVSTANGQAFTARTRLSHLTLGSIVINDLPVSVADKGNLFTNLLGMQTLDRLAGFERRGDQLILYSE